MEISSSALTGALRIGVQVIVGRKRPVLEVYQQFHNDFYPPSRAEQRHRQSIFIDLTLINIGGDRAENVTFEISGDFRREGVRRDLPERFSAAIMQVAPGQAFYLMRIEGYDLNVYVPEKAGDMTVHKPAGMKTDVLSITVHYDGPNTLLNRLLRLPRRWQGLKQYSTDFTFNPMNFVGDLPPPKYS